jgi:exopolysaccharide biosynthesis polyprenyl glycosylphosphotransferase
MLKREARVVAAAVFAADLGATVGAFLIAHALLRAVPLPGVGVIYGIEFYLELLYFIVPGWAVLLQVNAVYKSQRVATLSREVWRLTRAVGLAGLGLFAYQAMTKSGHISRALLGTFVVLDWGLLVALHLAIRIAARRTRERGYNYRTVVIVGTGEKAKGLAHRIVRNRHWGLKLLGYVAEPGTPPGDPIAEHRILGTVDDLPRLLREQVVDEVLVAVGRERLPDLEGLFLHCEQVGVNARLAADFFPHLIARTELEDFEGVPLLTFSTTPRDPWALAAKRVMDVLISGSFLLAFCWLYALLALAVKLSSKGPVFFTQERVGLYGRRFRLVKFRTMVADAEARKAALAHLNEMDGPTFKMKNDPRVTTVGRVLRKFSLDELPQFWNVLRGDMSLVGPRPPVPAEVEKYETWQRRRLSMRPGITCIWQVSGRNTIDFQKWMEMDLDYIDRWSLGLDVKLLLKTIPAVLGGRGAS